MVAGLYPAVYVQLTLHLPKRLPPLHRGVQKGVRGAEGDIVGSSEGGGKVREQNPSDEQALPTSGIPVLKTTREEVIDRNIITADVTGLQKPQMIYLYSTRY